MTVKDIINGPDWVLWVVFVVLGLLSLVMLSGRGAFLIAGYNTASEEEKAKYDEKKLCRVTGAGLSVIAVLVFVMAKWCNLLPLWYVYLFGGVTLAACVIMIILLNTVCKNK